MTSVYRPLSCNRPVNWTIPYFTLYRNIQNWPDDTIHSTRLAIELELP